jgi:hypothetical protein
VKGPRRGPGSSPSASADWPEGPPPPDQARPVPSVVDSRAVPPSWRAELYGLEEVARLVQAKNKYRLRQLLPPPDYELECGPIWTGQTVREWLRTAEKVR